MCLQRVNSIGCGVCLGHLSCDHLSVPLSCAPEGLRWLARCQQRVSKCTALSRSQAHEFHLLDGADRPIVRACQHKIRQGSPLKLRCAFQ